MFQWHIHSSKLKKHWIISKVIISIRYIRKTKCSSLPCMSLSLSCASDWSISAAASLLSRQYHPTTEKWRIESYINYPANSSSRNREQLIIESKEEENPRQSVVTSRTLVTLGLLGEFGHVNMSLPFLLRRHCGAVKSWTETERRYRKWDLPMMDQAVAEEEKTESKKQFVGGGRGREREGSRGREREWCLYTLRAMYGEDLRGVIEDRICTVRRGEYLGVWKWEQARNSLYFSCSFFFLVYFFSLFSVTWAHWQKKNENFVIKF